MTGEFWAQFVSAKSGEVWLGPYQVGDEYELGNSTAVAEIDWAYELLPRAKTIYDQKLTQVPCEEIPELINTDNEEALHIAIRDAALFQSKSCGPIIRAQRQALEKLNWLRPVVAFYFLFQGEQQQLQYLATVFDEEARRIGDHVVVELFGFLPDWDVSGVRLVRHAGYSDGASAELLCSALIWRRYLYGENSFLENWKNIGRREGIPQKRLNHFYTACKYSP